MPFERVAADRGYVRDERASTRANPVLRAPGLPKPVTRRRGNVHRACFSTRDPDGSGTAIGFMPSRGLSFAGIRARFGTPAACRPLIRRDSSGRVLFARRGGSRRLTGFGIGPPDGPGRFATGGTRSLFAVRAGSAGDIEALAVTESAVDALSLARTDGCPAGQAFLSTAGAPSRSQRERTGLAAGVFPNVRTVILAQDGDEAGERQAGILRERLKVPPHVTVRRRRPPENAGWNDVVNADAKG